MRGKGFFYRVFSDVAIAPILGRRRPDLSAAMRSTGPRLRRVSKINHSLQ